MKFLCLAYGDEAGWNAFDESGKREALAADAVIRERGNPMSAVRQEVATVSNHGGKLVVTAATHAQHALPLAGYSVIEAASVEEVVALVARTPCARAGGYIEVRALWDLAGTPQA